MYADSYHILFFSQGIPEHLAAKMGELFPGEERDDWNEYFVAFLRNQSWGAPPTSGDAIVFAPTGLNGVREVAEWNDVGDIERVRRFLDKGAVFVSCVVRSQEGKGGHEDPSPLEKVEFLRFVGYDEELE